VSQKAPINDRRQQALHLDLFPGFSRVIPIKRVFSQVGLLTKEKSPLCRIARLKGEHFDENNGSIRIVRMRLPYDIN
jgi:hypothetical protein